MLLTRDSKGQLFLSNKSFRTAVSNMFSICKDEKEVKWVQNQLASIINESSDEKIKHIAIDEDF